MYRKLEEFLAAKQARYQVIAHSGAVTAQEQAHAVHTSGWSVAKVLIVKERDGYVMAILPAACVADLDRLKGAIGHGEVRLADVEEIASVIPDCAPGAIPPFGALFGLRTFVDRALLNTREVTMPAGDLATAIRMRTAEFRRLANPRVADFAVPERLVAPPGRGRARRLSPSAPWATRQSVQRPRGRSRDTDRDRTRRT